MFQLDPRLEDDTVDVARFVLCRVRLMRDARYPWLVLVPARPGLREIHDLDTADRTLLIDEIARASRVLETLHAPGKINVGALGNIVAQLHVHVIARREGDAAWPGPVWGQGAPVAYGDDALAAMRGKLTAAFAGAG